MLLGVEYSLCIWPTIPVPDLIIATAYKSWVLAVHTWQVLKMVRDLLHVAGRPQELWMFSY